MLYVSISMVARVGQQESILPRMLKKFVQQGRSE